MKAVKLIVVGLVIFIAGIGIGYAQRGQADFVLEVTAPKGETFVKCLSGCALIGFMDLPNQNAGKMTEYSYNCSGDETDTCTARVAGFREF